MALDIPPQDVITRDNISIKVNAVLYMKVSDPVKAVIEIENYLYATSQLAQTTLRSVLGETELDELLADREKINAILKKIIDKRTEDWGIEVSAVEVKDVDLPARDEAGHGAPGGGGAGAARQGDQRRRASCRRREKLAQAARTSSARSRRAIQLRYLQTVTEIASENNSTTIFPIPIDLFTGLPRRGAAAPASAEQPLPRRRLPAPQPPGAAAARGSPGAARRRKAAATLGMADAPTLIDRAALERIIQRAAELQTGERDIGDGLTPDEVLALGKDVGIPARYLQQALLEERTRHRAGAEATGSRSLGGPGGSTAQRVVPGDRRRRRAGAARAGWRIELLHVKRRHPDRITWEPQAGCGRVACSAALRAGGKDRSCWRGPSEITATVTPLEAGFCHVQLAADVRNLRRGLRRRRGSARGARRLAAADPGDRWRRSAGRRAALPVVLAPASAAPSPAATGRSRERVQVGLEQVLDHLEQGEAHRPAPPSTPSWWD